MLPKLLLAWIIAALHNWLITIFSWSCRQ